MGPQWSELKNVCAHLQENFLRCKTHLNFIPKAISEGVMAVFNIDAFFTTYHLTYYNPPQKSDPKVGGTKPEALVPPALRVGFLRGVCKEMTKKSDIWK